MNTAEVLTIIGSILIPMFAGFGWIIHQISDLKTRVTVMETVLMMMGAPLKFTKPKDHANLYTHGERSDDKQSS